MNEELAHERLEHYCYLRLQASLEDEKLASARLAQEARELEARVIEIKNHLNDIERAIIEAHGKALPENWAYSGPVETVHLLVAEILTLRKEVCDPDGQARVLRGGTDAAMKGTDVTPEQLAHAEAFLRETAAPVPVLGAKTTVDVEHLIRLLAWYGAIRSKSGRETPNPLVRLETYCNCANPGVDLTTGLCDCVTPATLKCACHTPSVHEDAIPRHWEYRETILEELQGRYESILGPELFARREKQDAEHGGAAHDDTHEPYEWAGFMHKFIRKACGFILTQAETASERMRTIAVGPNWEAYEDALFDVAALAVAAIQSSRRRRSCQ